MKSLREAALTEFCAAAGISPESQRELDLLVRRIAAQAIRTAERVIEDSEEYLDGAPYEDLLPAFAAFIDSPSS